jgi:uncharacterized protein (TIGR03086 family)
LPQEATVVGTPLESLTNALGLFGRLVAGVGPEQWSLPTPCEDWNVQQLVGHVVSGQRLLARVLRGEPAEEPSSQATGPATGDRSHDLVAEYRASAEELLAALAEPDALGRVVTVPAGTVPGAVAVHLRTTEALVHGWDLARATGLRFDVPDELAEAELAFSRPMLERIPPERRRFAPAQPVADDAPAIDRLAALLGRTQPGGGIAP